MAINLTEGAIEMMSREEVKESDLQPVLQVADIKLVNSQNPNNTTERYRMLLSDGLYLQQGMLGTQLNELVKSEQLQKGSIVQLTHYFCNKIQNRMIIIILNLNLLLQKCDVIGEPKVYQPNTRSETPPLARASGQGQPSINQPSTVTGNLQPSGGNSLAVGSVTKPNVGGVTRMNPPEMDRSAGSHSYGSSFVSNADPGRYNSTSASPMYSKTESAAGISRAPLNGNVRPLQPAYQQSPPMYTNRGPVAKNEAPPRVIPIAALNPYQGRWTIKARVTAKGELRHYSNPRGEGKVFSFDLLDSDSGEIRVTCFNAVADQFYNQIEAGKLYLISRGSLKPAQKAFNHLRNEYEIFLDTTSTVQSCLEDDNSIPQQQFHFRSISQIEAIDNNSIVDVIGLLSFIGPSTSIMRKNGTETQKRTLHLKDMSGRSVELTLWGSFCNAEGQALQNMCDSGVFPSLAVKSGRVNDFNGKSLGTISTSQLFIDPDFPEARELKAWFDNEGKNIPSVSISKQTIGKTDVQKTISQIQDERLGTSENPDWITVSATISFIRTENFCYTACPLMVGDRKCHKKVTNNGDGKWRCERCDQSVDECEYRYILQFQIQDHTGITRVTAFQECGEEIMGVSAKDLYYLKYEEQDEEKFGEIVRSASFIKYLFKLKVKEETFSDEQRVKSTVVKAEKVDFSSETRFLLDLIVKAKGEDSSFPASKPENVSSITGLNNTGFGNAGNREPAPPIVNYKISASPVKQEFGVQANPVGQYGNQYRHAMTGSTGVHMSCNSCGGVGHNSTNCPSFTNSQGHSYGEGVGNRAYSGAAAGGGGGGASDECYKCHQFGHWARDCPGVRNVPPAYGSGNVTTGKYGSIPKQHVGGF